MTDSIKVSSLGKFEIINSSGILNDDILHSNMLKKLLIYLLIHRNAPVCVNELSEALWLEEEIESPGKALNNLVYRLRTIMKKSLGNNQYILTGPGTYMWNKDISVDIDVEEFEELCKKKIVNCSDTERINRYKRAVDLYGGYFLESSLEAHWVVILSTYYHSMYIEVLKELCILYLENKEFQELEKLCITSLKHEVADEELYYYYILSLIKQKKHDLAISKYEEATNYLYSLLGIQNFEKLDSIWEELKQADSYETPNTLKIIHKDLIEVEEPSGVFFCGYPLFKEIYRLEVRKNSRRGESYYIILFTVDLEEYFKITDTSMREYLIDQAMNNLRSVLQTVLRTGDVVTRYSRNQYIILLSTCTYESSVKVSKRIIGTFEKYYKRKIIKIKTEFDQISGYIPTGGIDGAKD